MDRSLFTQREIAERISGWIKLYATRKAFCESLVVGISGGIDSALVSTLCAMTGMKTYVVFMGIRQDESQKNRAIEHAKWLKDRFENVEFVEMYLDGIFDHFENVMIHRGFDSELGFANSRSRIRMFTLYQIATSKKGIVVGTGNKVEDFGVGFFTKYGDGGVDISPIGDFNKSEVRNLSKELGIVDSIIQAKPTDGLWGDERSDEDQIGATYEELEWAMFFLEENPFFEDEDFEKLSKRQKEVLNIYIVRHKNNLHKMTPIPVFKM